VGLSRVLGCAINVSLGSGKLPMLIVFRAQGDFYRHTHVLQGNTSFITAHRRHRGTPRK
jgi:hypothetical protein